MMSFPAHSSIGSVAIAAVLIVGLGLNNSGMAHADDTALSSTYKTAIDEVTHSKAASAATPGGSVVGDTHPGDTIKWVVHYQNNTTSNAAVNVKDSLANAGDYVPGSLELPPSADPASTVAPQYSTDGGSTWLAGLPPANATNIGMTAAPGALPPSLQQKFVHPPSPVAVSLSNSGGDGYAAISSADGSQVYAVFHHNSSNTNVFCATSSGGLCQGWPAGSNVTATYVSPVAGTPIGAGGNGMRTARDDGAFVAGGNLYWAAYSTTAVGATYPTGLMCLNLSTLQSCGFIQLGAALFSYSSISGTGVPATDGNYYFSDNSGNLLCFNPSSGPCATTSLPGVTPSAVLPSTVTYGRYVFTEMQATAAATTATVFCFDTSMHAQCPGYPVGGPTINNGVQPVATLAPILDTSGAVVGVCSFTYSARYGCWDTAGASIPNPYPAGAGLWSQVGDGWIFGSRVYLPVNQGNSVGCFDFALPLAGGQVQPCAGFTPAANALNYTTRAMTGNPTCLLADGDGRQITSFDAYTGGPCTTSEARIKAAPAQAYCGSGIAGFKAWDKLSITAPAGTYSSATVTIADATGAPVPGYSNITVPSGQTVDLSSIPTTIPTDELTAKVTFRSATTAITSAQVTLSWAGNMPEMCYKTVVPTTSCGLPSDLSNEAVTVTDGTAAGGGSDAPAGNRSGAARFTVSPTASQCNLTITKTSSASTVKPGDSVTYTITVKNTGTMAYVNPAPPSFTDDLSDVLTDANYNGDATATAGTVSYTKPVLSWTGPAQFKPGDTATITYTATVRNPDAGPHHLRNVVVSDSPGNNCPRESQDSACTTTITVTGGAAVNTGGSIANTGGTPAGLGIIVAIAAGTLLIGSALIAVRRRQPTR